jgi:Tfp pilus assembly protein PilZ
MKSEETRPKADARTKLRAPMIIQKILIDGDCPSFFGYIENISKSGIFIASTNPILPGEQINLTFQLPPPLKGTVCCICEVVWKRPLGSHLPFEPGMGMKFIDLPDVTGRQIDNWIKEFED